MPTSSYDHLPRLGAVLAADGRCRFRVWAPHSAAVDLQLLDDRRTLAMTAHPRGYHELVVEDVRPGARYLFQLEGGTQRPDPASYAQPSGVHEASAVVDPQFDWHDAAWRAPPWEAFIIYELHVGTFTRAGTFAAAADRLPELVALGVTCVEIMPVAQFPGERNWGYDGVYPYAVQHSYGGPDALKAFVDRCHQLGLAVLLDVVYNHLGPEGNYLRDFGPYFTSAYHTPWGDALNFDGPESDEVREFFVQNALRWQAEFHLDGLRLDAVHAIKDESAVHLLAELAARCGRLSAELGRPFYLVAESDQNDARLVRSPDRGGHGLQATWSDDFHHALHTLLTGERAGYYLDFGAVEQLGAAIRQGAIYCGQRSEFRARRHGNAFDLEPAARFVVCGQNHDQVGNRATGDRFSHLVCHERRKLAAATLLLSPYVPLLFMGEEYAETAPFLYFTSHSDPALVEAVRRGRREEFARFAWKGEVPDPDAASTFERSRLAEPSEWTPEQRALWEFYRTLIELRQSHPALAQLDKRSLQVQTFPGESLILVERQADRDAAGLGPPARIAIALHFGPQWQTLRMPLAIGNWQPRIDSAAAAWAGPVHDPPQSYTSRGWIERRFAPWSALVLDWEESA